MYSFFQDFNLLFLFIQEMPLDWVPKFQFRLKIRKFQYQTTKVGLNMYLRNKLLSYQKQMDILSNQI